MRHRVEDLVLPAGIRPPFIATFHAACVRILREHAAHVGLAAALRDLRRGRPPRRIVKEAMRELALRRARRSRRAAAVHRISHAKNQMLDGRGGRAARPHPARGARGLALPPLRGAAARDGRARLRRPAAARGAAVRDEPGDARRYRERWRYVLVDEYQDTNRAQYRIVRRLTEGHRNLCVVGDPDQSVYRWRGADLRNILDFEKDFPDCRVVPLEQNYRSTKRILVIADAVIQHNTARKDKRLWTENAEGDRAVRVPRVGRARGGRVRGPRDPRALHGARPRLPGHRGVLPDQRPVPRARGRAAPREHPLRDRRRRALLRAARDQGRGRLPAPRGEPARRRGVPPRRRRARARRSARPRSTISPRPPAGEQRSLLQACAALPAGRRPASRGARSRSSAGSSPGSSPSGPRCAVPALIDEVLAASGYREALKAERTAEAEARLENLEELIAAVRGVPGGPARRRSSAARSRRSSTR